MYLKINENIDNVSKSLNSIENILIKLAEHPELLKKLNNWIYLIVFLIVLFLAYKIARLLINIHKENKYQDLINKNINILGKLEALLYILNNKF